MAHAGLQEVGARRTNRWCALTVPCRRTSGRRRRAAREAEFFASLDGMVGMLPPARVHAGSRISRCWFEARAIHPRPQSALRFPNNSSLRPAIVRLPSEPNCVSLPARSMQHSPANMPEPLNSRSLFGRNGRRDRCTYPHGRLIDARRRALRLYYGMRRRVCSRGFARHRCTRSAFACEGNDKGVSVSLRVGRGPEVPHDRNVHACQITLPAVAAGRFERYRYLAMAVTSRSAEAEARRLAISRTREAG